MYRIRTAGLALVIATFCTPVRAQHDVQPGDRVRVSVPQVSAKPVVGTVVADLPGMLRLSRGVGSDDTFDIPWGMVSRLEVSRGRLSRGQGVRRGALRGLAAGALVGVLGGAVLAVGVEERNEHTEVDEGRAIATLALRFGAIGAAAGGVIGFQARENWVRLPYSGISVGLKGDSPQLTFSLQF
jgi:hypothetical protein